MVEIRSREHVKVLVDTFYSKIRKDEMLGPIFNESIPQDHWPEHLDKLTDFWETNLFGIPKFKGNPVAAHRKVDKHFEYKIGQEHFAKWLEIWFDTIDSLFEGDLARRAKDAARNMSTNIFITMWSVRPENQSNQATP